MAGSIAMISNASSSNDPGRRELAMTGRHHRDEQLLDRRTNGRTTTIECSTLNEVAP